MSNRRSTRPRATGTMNLQITPQNHILAQVYRDQCQNIHAFMRDDKSIVNWLSKDAEALDYFAGDVERVPRNLWDNFEMLRQKRGEELFVDLLMALTHKRFDPNEARNLWNDILVHKYFMSEKLGRNVGVRVAVLDFLDNQRGLAGDLRLLPEKDLDCLLLFVNEDGLTGLYNHRFFQEQLRHELGRARRYHRPLSLLIMDLDHFKQYNDQFGHRHGDELLRRVAEFFEDSRRDSDTVARYGGDEFAIILPETGHDEALGLAKRLRVDFESRRFGGPMQDGSFITVSIGVEAYPSDAQNVEDLIELADQALYRAKRAGRNCVRTNKTLKASKEQAQ